MLKKLVLSILISTIAIDAIASMSCRFTPWKKQIDRKIVNAWLQAPKLQSYTRLGVDMELELPSNVHQGEVFKAFENMLHTMGVKKMRFIPDSIQNDPELNFYIDRKEKHLIFSTENFPTRDNYEPFELSFPIMTNWEQTQILMNSFGILKSFGAESGPYAGFHLHFDGRDLSQIDFLMFIEIMSQLYKENREKWSPSKQRRHLNAQRYQIESLKYLLHQPHKILNNRSVDEWQQKTEGYFIEWNKTHETVEVKFPESTISRTQATEYLLWTKSIYDAVRRKEPWLVDILLSGKKIETKNFRQHLRIEF